MHTIQSTDIMISVTIYHLLPIIHYILSILHLSVLGTYTSASQYIEETEAYIVVYSKVELQVSCLLGVYLGV